MILALAIGGTLVAYALAMLRWRNRRPLTAADANYAAIDAELDAKQAAAKAFAEHGDQAVKVGNSHREGKPLTPTELAAIVQLEYTYKIVPGYERPERAS